jgi:hypothetical protein
MNILGFLNPYNDALEIYLLLEKTSIDSVLFIKYADELNSILKKFEIRVKTA